MSAGPKVPSAGMGAAVCEELTSAEACLADALGLAVDVLEHLSDRGCDTDMATLVVRKVRLAAVLVDSARMAIEGPTSSRRKRVGEGQSAAAK